MAADSRTIRSGPVATPTDDACKITSLDEKVVFVSANIVRFQGGPRVAGWDNEGIIRAAYSKVSAANPVVRGQLPELAKEWSEAVAARFNAVASQEPGVFRQMISDIGRQAFTVA